jgi:hypothetical protein
MSTEYKTQGGSRTTRLLEDISLDPPEVEAEQRTRRIVRPQLVENAKDASQPVRITLVHQRRHSNTEEWQDVDSFNLATLKAGQEVKLSLSCAQTHKLKEVLDDLHTVTEDGLPPHGKKIAVIDSDQTALVSGEAKRVLEELLESEGEGVWAILDRLKPGLFKTEMLKRQHQERARAVELFSQHIDDPIATEPKWQKFFETNEWIFGHGLDYRFLHRIQAQANYGGVELDGTGAPRGDFIMATMARVGFTVLVEIKTPFTPLLGNGQYRNRAYKIGPELSGGVAQVQAQCAIWAEEGARGRNNAERLQKADIHTYEPKGILVIGDTRQIAEDPDKRATFERFRRNLHNPEILTFDELLQRAKFMVCEPQNS